MKENKEITAILETAKKAAIVGGKILKKHFGETLKVEEKKQTEVVTFVDRNSEAAIKKFILKNFPTHAFLGEESGASHKDNENYEYRWIVDPLDGTTNYVRGFKNFCVSVGVEHKKKGIIAGVVYEPMFGDMYFATKGGGAFLNGKRIHCSKVKTLNKAVMTTGFAYAKGLQLKKQMNYFLQMNEQTMAVRRPGAAALDLAYVASGVFDGFWERGLSPWDIAAGILLVKEAGGVITDYSGDKTIDLWKREILASNKNLHKSILNILD